MAAAKARSGGAANAAGHPAAAEDQAAEGEAEPEDADRETADREYLAPLREPLPAAERLLLVRRQRLATTLLAQRAPGPESEIEIVEDFRCFLGHFAQC